MIQWLVLFFNFQESLFLGFSFFNEMTFFELLLKLDVFGGPLFIGAKNLFGMLL